ncbi:MAG: hypothetical protein Q8M11_18135 [Sulfuritalea sp.]|nr:hypothetical protein [Sulfuritalea sp.]MDP1982643.1 hypothetical protein [Sulfuritalea sp.]
MKRILEADLAGVAEKSGRNQGKSRQDLSAIATQNGYRRYFKR